MNYNLTLGISLLVVGLILFILPHLDRSIFEPSDWKIILFFGSACLLIGIMGIINNIFSEKKESQNYPKVSRE